MKRFGRSFVRKYRQLLIVLVVTFWISPFIQEGIGNSLIDLLMLYAIIVIIRGLGLPKFLMAFYTAIAFMAFLIQFTTDMGWVTFSNPTISLIPQGVFAIYLGGAAYRIGHDIFTSPKVTLDTVQGGISVYLLIGYVWALFYGMIATLNVDAFSQQIVTRGYFLKALYFSFTTLTTLGYGDILPVSDVALVFTNMEAIVGQMYSTVFIAILVGGYLSQHSEEVN